jgi:hypothetical protein
MWALHDLRHLLNVVRDPLLSWQLLSHKALRYLAFIPQCVLLVASVMSLKEGDAYTALFAVQLIFYVLAGTGYLMRRLDNIPVVFSAPYYFVLLNAACMVATFKFLAGTRQTLWQPRTG